MRVKLAIVCLVFGLVLAIAWPCTFRRPAAATVYLDRGRPLAIESAKGEICLVFSNAPLGTDLEWTVSAIWGPASAADQEQYLLDSYDVRYRGGGFFYQKQGNVLGRVDLNYRVLAVPIWFLLIAMLIVVWRLDLPGARRRRRIRLGLCPACGYDVRATPGRCPECGLVLA